MRLDRERYSSFPAGLDRPQAGGPRPSPHQPGMALCEDMTYDCRTPAVRCEIGGHFSSIDPAVMMVAARAELRDRLCSGLEGMGCNGRFSFRGVRGIAGRPRGPSKEPPFAAAAQADMLSRSSRLPTQTATEPVRAGRAMAPIDKKRLRSLRKAFKAGGGPEAETRPPAPGVPRRFIRRQL